MHHARAYIHLNRRSFKKISLQTMRITSELIISEQYEAIKDAFFSACGQFSNEPKKTWLIDADNSEIKDEETLEEIKKLIIELQKEAQKEPRLDIIPTLNGHHFITWPFNSKKFHDKFPNIEIKKDSPTILYAFDPSH
jgi:hypothetical protein